MQRKRASSPRNAGKLGLQHWQQMYGAPPDPGNEEASNTTRDRIEAQGKAVPSPHSPTAGLDEQADPSIAKYASVALYCTNILPTESVDRLFVMHPEWRAA